MDGAFFFVLLISIFLISTSKTATRQQHSDSSPFPPSHWNSESAVCWVSRRCGVAYLLFTHHRIVIVTTTGFFFFFLVAITSYILVNSTIAASWKQQQQQQQRIWCIFVWFGGGG